MSFTLPRAGSLGGYLLASLLGLGSASSGQAEESYDLAIVPNPSPEASSVLITLTAPVLGSAQSSSSLSGELRLVTGAAAEPFGYGLIEDMVLELKDGIDFELPGLSISAAPSAARVLMLEPGPSGDTTGGRFDQLTNEMDFEGEISISIQEDPFDLQQVAPVTADILGVQLSMLDERLTARVQFDLDFSAAVSTPLGQIPIEINILGTVLAVEPGVGDFDRNGVLDVEDISRLQTGIRQGDLGFDLNEDQVVDFADLRTWVETVKRTYFGDANLDDVFDSNDLVEVFIANQYNDGIDANSDWSTGDWNGDREFNDQDIVVAFTEGGYLKEPRAAVSAVPEPTSSLLVGCLMTIPYFVRQSRRRPETRSVSEGN